MERLRLSSANRCTNPVTRRIPTTSHYDCCPVSPTSLSGTRRSSSSARLARDIPISSDNSHRPAIGFENDSDNKYDNKECRVGIDLEEGELGVDFDGRKITYGFGELDELVLA